MKRLLPMRLQRRRGVSLIEVMVVISMGTIFLSLTVGTIHLLMRAQSTAGKALLQTQTLCRLSEQFRRDVHAATAAEVTPAAEDKPAVLKLTLPGERSVTYELDQHQVRCIRQQAETTHRDQFSFLAGTKITAQQEDGLIRLTLDPSGVAETQQSATWKQPVPVEALLSRDQRFVKP